MSLTRRQILTAAAALPLTMVAAPPETIVTVRGPIRADRLGLALSHEHVLVDFIGADKITPERWDRAEVARVMLPHLLAAKKQGVRAFFDCTPAFLGRDPRLLRNLAVASGLHVITNTGLYKEPYLPPYAFTESAEQLAGRWTREAVEGIEGTGIRPGFIKIAVNPGKLIEVQRKIVRAAALTSRRTGLAIACHSGSGPATLEALEVLREERVPLSRFIFVHAEGEPDRKLHAEAAKAGAWVSFDGVGWRPVAEHMKLIAGFLAEGHADRLLLSHDGGWYKPGEPGGGTIQPFTRLLGDLMPALEKEGLKPALRRKLLVENPRRAFAVAGTAAGPAKQ
jgi:phosphotriesterase-related protein